MFRVQKRMCATCIYGPNTQVRRTIAQLEAEVADPKMKGFFKGYRACHHARSNDVCCRGFWEAHKDDFQAGQIAQRLKLVEFVDIDDL